MPAVQSQSNAELSAMLLRYNNSVDALETPAKVLNAPDEVTNAACKIRMLGALLLPLRWGDLSSLEMGKNRLSPRKRSQGLVGRAARYDAAVAGAR